MNREKLLNMVFGPLDRENFTGPTWGYSDNSRKAHIKSAGDIMRQLPPRFQTVQRLSRDEGAESLSSWIQENSNGGLPARLLHYFAVELEEAPHRGYFAWLDTDGRVMPRVSYSAGVTNWTYEFLNAKATKESVGQSSFRYYKRFCMDYRRKLENMVCEYLHPERENHFGNRPDPFYCANLGSTMTATYSDNPKIVDDALTRMGFKRAFTEASDIFDPEVVAFVSSFVEREATIGEYISLKGFWNSIRYFERNNPSVMTFLADNLLNYTFEKYGPMVDIDDPNQIMEALRYLRGERFIEPGILVSDIFKNNLSILSRRYREKPDLVPAV